MSAFTQQISSSTQEARLGAVPAIMRVAVAGSGGLAYWIAHYLSTETYHPFMILSRAVGPIWSGWSIEQLLTVISLNPISQPKAGKSSLLITRMDQAFSLVSQALTLSYPLLPVTLNFRSSMPLFKLGSVVLRLPNSRAYPPSAQHMMLWIEADEPL